MQLSRAMMVLLLWIHKRSSYRGADDVASRCRSGCRCRSHNLNMEQRKIVTFYSQYFTFQPERKNRKPLKKTCLQAFPTEALTC